MSRVRILNQRYAASASLARGGIEIIAVGDPAGARLDDAVRRLLLVVREDGPGLWDDLLGATKALRWRLITQPQPIELNPSLRDGARQVQRQVQRLRGAVANDGLLAELAAAAAAVTKSDPVLGGVLMRSIEEAGPGDCVVVAASKSARAGLENWLRARSAVVLTPGELAHIQRADHAYVIGPPRYFAPSLVTAPVTTGISFHMPAWFSDRTVPRSAIAQYAEGAIHIEARVFTEGVVAEPEPAAPKMEDEDEFLPQPVWGTRQAPDREPSSDEVEARKILLSGNLGMWLDDGDRIRTLDPQKPAGERVTYIDVNTVRAGTYLLLREGETERGVLYQAALNLAGKRSELADASQRNWKHLLAERLSKLGHREVVRQLAAEEVKTAGRARAWTDPNLIRPHSDYDFERLLQWLGLPVQPAFGHATWLRKMLHQATTDIREQLEAAVSAADLSVLERDGHMSLNVQAEGFRGILATRVLAISLYTEIVTRHEARVLFEDRSGQWLE